MNLIRRTFVSLTALLVMALLITNTGADAAVTIQKISESELDEMIGARNNKVVISFMAAWCGPCIDELPVLNKLYHRYKDRGLKLVGVSIDLEGPRAMQPIVDKLKIGFPVYWYGESAVQKFSIFAIPMIFLVKDGRIVEKLPGRRPGRELDKKIRKFLAQ
ncbi:MAG: TlpA disulfide reductase family protein [Desulfobacterales bacterium]|nr:TlpA disulfide reductase family protein [Desulfobacterales bacterium]